MKNTKVQKKAPKTAKAESEIPFKPTFRWRLFIALLFNIFAIYFFSTTIQTKILASIFSVIFWIYIFRKNIQLTEDELDIFRSGERDKKKIREKVLDYNNDKWIRGSILVSFLLACGLFFWKPHGVDEIGQAFIKVTVLLILTFIPFFVSKFFGIHSSLHLGILRIIKIISIAFFLIVFAIAFISLHLTKP